MKSEYEIVFFEPCSKKTVFKAKATKMSNASIPPNFTVQLQEMKESRLARNMLKYPFGQAILEKKRIDWSNHLSTCTDHACIATHQRHNNWLARGKIGRLGRSLTSLGQGQIGLLLSVNRVKMWRFLDLLDLFPTVSEYSISRRMRGLLESLKKQRALAKTVIYWRTHTAGAVKKRHDIPLHIAKARLLDLNPDALVTKKGIIKVFSGFKLPKRGARVGDIYIRGGARAICIGRNLWMHADGSRSRLVKNAWVKTLPTDFEGMD